MSRKTCRIVPLLFLVVGVALAEETAPPQPATPAPAQQPTAQPAPASQPVPAAPVAAAKPTQSHADFSLTQVAVCTGVEDRAPVGEASNFAPSVGMLYCFTRVDGAPAPTQIYHRWYVGDRLVTEIPLNIGASGWRCWSAKTVRPGMTGPCRVDIVTEEGDVLGTKEFTLDGGATPAPAPNQG
jgi:hypothetical protein